ncbi:hypothetical protein [Antrihabitans stalactiti]|uniref:Uncharacterized protein n=1 Tax=Antrihabitans stalactiti TaxID=2584121 RepID=A0A848KGL3_9NOCA|nr:hypothetical protein [Antrihabitans stalactiti]NMN98153.1 hypothetical protein [Antrihabitans stalactiti]
MSGMTFHEVMTGQLAKGVTDPRKGYRTRGSSGIALRARIDIDDIAAFLTDTHHRGNLNAAFEIPRWGAQHATSKGDFNLFSPAGDRASLMIYEAPILLDGVEHWLRGVKRVEIAGPWRMWPATTTLLVEVRTAKGGAGVVVASGILRLNVLGLVASIATMRGTGVVWPLRHFAVVRYLTFFAWALVCTYILRRRP